MTACILRVALPVPLNSLFDYSWEGNGHSPQPGCRVEVPFGKRTLVGVIVDIATDAEKKDYTVRKALSLLDETPLLNAKLMQFLQWIADYYRHPYGQVTQNALPNLLLKGRAIPTREPAQAAATALLSAPQLHAEQQQVIQAVEQNLDHFNVFVLEGITGSGKTEVYLRLLERVLACGKQALVLVPEISLTPQTLQRFRDRLAVPILGFHSQLSDQERLRIWVASQKNIPQVIIGTRSAIFLPLAKLGLLIIDEEHDLSYKQQDRCRYHARDVAIWRAQQQRIPILLGSATLSLETLYNVTKNKYHHYSLTQKAISNQKTQTQLIDIRNEKLEAGLSKALLSQMQQHLAAGHQVLLFLNRRGYAPITLCHACGHIERCERCETSLILHANTRKLSCHHCGAERRFQTSCRHCQQDLISLGIGTERIEEKIKQIFPHYAVARIDRDTVKTKKELEAMLEGIHQKKYQILLGTQMLAKGHHFPDLTLVGIIDVDNAFFSADFRAMEYMGQLITQVAGRTGRTALASTVLLQTHQPDHPQLHLLLEQGYSVFAAQLLSERKKLQLPPFTYWAIIRAEARSLTQALLFLKEIKPRLLPEVNGLGPIPAAQAKRAGYYRAHCILQSNSRVKLQQQLDQLIPYLSQLKAAKKLRWHLDRDPVECA